MDGGRDWSGSDNALVVTAYLEMLEAELRERPYVKIRANEMVQRRTGRSRGSVEFKFRNISAVLGVLRHPWIDGYKPAPNYQETLVGAVTDALAARPSLAEAAFEAVVKPAPLRVQPVDWNVIAPPHLEIARDFGSQGLPRGVKRDYVRLEAENHALGLAGERAVGWRERALLEAAGRPDLARRVEHVSETRGDGLGFDILSFDADGTEKFIEVKTTRRGREWPILASRNEVSFSVKESARFHVFRLFDFAAPRPGLYTVQGRMDHMFTLAPVSFEALPR